MIVHHGSNIRIPQPDLNYTQKNVDFGPGFYTTTVREQAEKWEERFRDTGGDVFANQYQLDEKRWDV